MRTGKSLILQSNFVTGISKVNLAFETLSIRGQYISPCGSHLGPLSKSTIVNHKYGGPSGSDPVRKDRKSAPSADKPPVAFPNRHSNFVIRIFPAINMQLSTINLQPPHLPFLIFPFSFLIFPSASICG
jgi:hypothetical protein